jgi:AraC-like DNA-binding protein
MTQQDHPAKRNQTGRDDPVIRCHRLTPGTMKPEDTFDEFWDASAEVYDATIPDLPEARKRGVEAATWRLDNLVFVGAELSAFTCSRSRQRVRDCDMGFIQLSIGEGAADGRLVVGDTVYTTAQNGAYLNDFSAAHTEIAGTDDYLAVFIPHAAVGYDPARHAPFMFLNENTAAGRLLTDAWNSVSRRLDSVRESEARALAAGLCGLVRGLMLRDGQFEETKETVKEARIRVMRGFIEANLRRPDLGIADLTANFGASRSTIFRDFSPSGGLDRYMMRRRLERAYVDLTDQPPTRGRITQVAESWGFQSMSHFYRAFRAEFGCAPGDVMSNEAVARITGCDEQSSQSSSLPVTSWLQRIGSGEP